MRRNLRIAALMTATTTALLGIIYPMAVTALAQLFFHDQANGKLLMQDDKLIGSRLIGQGFRSEKYFHSRPSAAGAGYDGANSGGSNLGPTNQILIDRIRAEVAGSHADDASHPVPVDLVTTSGSGLDPDISPAAAFFQVARIARVRRLRPEQVRALVESHIERRQFGFLGEPRVNLLELNLALDRLAPQ